MAKHCLLLAPAPAFSVAIHFAWAIRMFEISCISALRGSDGRQQKHAETLTPSVSHLPVARWTHVERKLCIRVCQQCVTHLSAPPPAQAMSLSTSTTSACSAPRTLTWSNFSSLFLSARASPSCSVEAILCLSTLRTQVPLQAPPWHPLD